MVGKIVKTMVNLLSLISRQEKKKDFRFIQSVRLWDGKNYDIFHYENASDKLRKELLEYTLPDGELQYVLNKTKSPDYPDYLQVILAKDKDGIKGWAGIYKAPEWHGETIGVYVLPKYRHIGIGGTLKQEAMNLCNANKLDYCWQDSNSRNWYYHRNKKWA